MKVRITDLLDSYYDHSVRLTPPEALHSGKENTENLPKKPSRAQTPLLIAASLLLVVTAASALGFGLHNSISGGKALSADNSIPVSDSAEAFAPAATSEPIPEPTAEPTPMPTDSFALDSAKASIVQDVDAQLISVTQTGDQLFFSLTLSPIPPEFYDGADDPAFRLDALQPSPKPTPLESQPLEGVTLSFEDYLSYDSETECLYLRGEMPVTEAGAEYSFIPAITYFGKQGSNLVFYGSEITIGTVSTTCSNFYSLSNAIFESDCDGLSEGIASVNQILISHDEILFSGTCTMDAAGSDPEIASTSWADAISQSLSCATLDFIMTDGETLHFQDSYDIGSLSYDVLENAQLRCHLSYTARETIDPREIQLWRLSLGNDFLPAEWNTTIYGIDGSSTGIQIANINLSFPHLGVADGSLEDTIVALAVDLDRGTFTWYENLFGEDPDSVDSGVFSDDLGRDLKNESAAAVYRETMNYILEHFYSNAFLVFTDGTKLQLGMGDSVGHDMEKFLFWDEGRLDVCAEDQNMRIDGLTIDYLLIGETRYEFDPACKDVTYP